MSKFMSRIRSVQRLIESIEALPAQEQTLLFEELFKRNIIKQRQENSDYSTVKLTSTWPMSPGREKFDPANIYSTVKVTPASAIGPVIKKLGQENTKERVNQVKFLDALRKADPLIIGEIEKPRQENTKETVKTKTLLTGNATCDIRAADRTNSGGDLDSSTAHVIIKNESDRTVSAALLGWPECKAFGETRSQALQNLQDLVNAQLAEAEIVSVKLTNSRSNNPWVRLAGKYENDPQYDEVLAHIEEYRRELDAETEAYYSQIDAAVETE
jgi:predicted RNase H-like HicB family nuclease